MRADAWCIYSRRLDRTESGRATLRREEIELPDPGPGDVVADTLWGCWEGNMGHAICRRPVDVCRLRGEDRVVIGNAGVVRVREVGPEVTTVRSGDTAILVASTDLDPYGYPTKIFGYDAPGTIGLLASTTVLPAHTLVPIPEGTRHSLQQWAAFSLRYVAAWSNWQLAWGVLRLQVPADKLPAPHVWGWGGGVVAAELDLARRAGCIPVMLSGNPAHREVIEGMGITAVNRLQYGALSFDEARYTRDPEYARAYGIAEKTFLADVERRTDGAMVHVFIDNIGSVHRVTLKALARQGIIATQGWKEGQVLSYLRAQECISRHQHVHTHGARYDESVAAVTFAEEHGWMPPVDPRAYTFDEVPRLSDDYLAGRTGMFPVYRGGGPS